MKVFINRKPIEGPWGGGNLLVKNLYAHSTGFGITMVDNPVDADLLFLFDPRPGNTGVGVNEIIKVSKEKSIPILHRVNECDARKATQGVDAQLAECSKYTDATVFVSRWMKNYHLESGWHNDNTNVVINGVDSDHFNNGSEFKFNNGKINLVTHHWSNNRLKGFDVYEEIDFLCGYDNDITFSYIGQHRNTFRNTKLVSPMFGKDLGAELKKYDIYISASRFDPGPNHILESLSCSLPTYVHKEGGGCVEFVQNSEFIYDDLGQLMSKIKKQEQPLVSNSVLRSWKACVSEYCELMKKIRENRE